MPFRVKPSLEQLPSYAEVCAACSRHVGRDDRVSDDYWCMGCVGDFEQLRRSRRLSWSGKVSGLLLVAGGLGVCSISAGNVPGASFLNWSVGAALLVVLWVAVLPFAHDRWQKLRFLRARRELMLAGLPITAAESLVFAPVAPGPLGSSPAPVPRGQTRRGVEPALILGPQSAASTSTGPLGMRPSSLVQRSGAPAAQAALATVVFPAEPVSVAAEEATRPSLLAPPPDRRAAEVSLRASMRVVERLARSEHPPSSRGTEAGAAVWSPGPHPMPPIPAPTALVNSRLCARASVRCSTAVLNCCSTYAPDPAERISERAVSDARVAR